MLNAVCTRYTIGHVCYFKTHDQFGSKNQSKGITLESMVTKLSYEDPYLKCMDPAAIILLSNIATVIKQNS